MAVPLIQPQGYLRMNPDSRIAMACHAVAVAGCNYNVVDGTPFRGYGQIATGTGPEGQTFQFRKNGMRMVGPVINVGTKPFVMLWRGRMGTDLGNIGYQERDPSFVIGSTNASMALVTRIGTGRSWSDSWGGLYNWDNVFMPAYETLTPGNRYSLALVRKVSMYDLWRDGVKVQSFAYGNTDNGDSAMCIGSFVEESYWNCSNDTDIAIRALIAPTDDEMRALFANPYSLFDEPTEEDAAEAIARAVRAALYMDGQGYFMPRPAGNSAKPLVLMPDGEIRQRSANEGKPIVLVGSELRTLADTEDLLA